MASLVNVLNEYFLKPRNKFCELAPVLKIIAPHPCPQQENGVDCGLFADAVSAYSSRSSITEGYVHATTHYTVLTFTAIFTQAG